MAVGVCQWLSITNEDKVSLHTAGSHPEQTALRQVPSVSLSASRSKVDIFKPQTRGLASSSGYG